MIYAQFLILNYNVCKSEGMHSIKLKTYSRQIRRENLSWFSASSCSARRRGKIFCNPMYGICVGVNHGQLVQEERVNFFSRRIEESLG